MEEAGAPGTDARGEQPGAPWGDLSRLGFALRHAADLDQVVRSVLAGLVQLPAVSRVGVALTEGGGRRYRFAALDRAESRDRAERLDLAWSHIDAFDDVPLTTAARTGEPVLGTLDELEGRYPGVHAHQRATGVRSLAAWPLPGVGAPVGGLVVFFDAVQSFPESQRRLLEAATRRTAEAVRRVRRAGGHGPGGAAPDVPDPGDEAHRASMLLDGDPRAAGAARRFLRERLEQWGVDDDTVDAAQLCISELVTNAVIHAHASSRLTVELADDALTVRVRDLGGAGRGGDPTPYLPTSDDEDPLRVFGRGLTLVDAVADRWGTEPDASGTTAWFVLQLVRGQGTPARTG